VKILIVEDEKIQRNFLGKALIRLGHYYLEANNGIECLDIVKHETFDLIVIDLKMPIMGGIETIEKLRESGNQTPILICSARGSDSDLVNAIHAGAQNYILKGYTLAALKDVINQFK